MALVDPSIISGNQPVTKAALGLQAVLEENKTNITDGSQALKRVIIGGRSPNLQYPAAFIRAGTARDAPSGNVLGKDAMELGFVINCIIRKLTPKTTFESAYRFGDALATVLALQPSRDNAWERLRVDRLTHGVVPSPNGGPSYSSIEVNVTALRYLRSG